MSDELKPCPFCGGEAECIDDTGVLVNGRRTWVVWCPDEECPVVLSTPLCETQEEAAAAWNTRSERTCEKVPGKMHYGERRPKCSNCGYGLGDDRWRYRPSCGARVVG